MYSRLIEKQGRIAVLGLGYVGLPLALELAKSFKVIGFDINRNNVDLLNRAEDPSKELGSDAFQGADALILLQMTAGFHAAMNGLIHGFIPP